MTSSKFLLIAERSWANKDEAVSMTASNIWSVPAYLPYVQPPLTPAIVASAERQLGVLLPASYLELLREQNGGYVRLTRPESMFETIWGIGPRWPSITDSHDWREPSAAERGYWLPKNPQALVPFDGDGHWYMCFDYRTCGPAGDPKVTYLDIECGSESIVAPTFTAFLSLLKPTEDPDCETLGIVGPWTLDAAAKTLSAVLKKPLEVRDAYAHGYESYFCSLGGRRDPQWVSISPNVVPRGFARADEPDYDELIKQLTGTSLRLPEYPELSVIVEFSQNAAARVKEACDLALMHTTAIGLPRGPHTDD